MAIANEAGINWQRFNSGDTAPAGSYWNPRTMSVQQNNATDAVLVKDGLWFRVDASGTQTLANIATTVNTALGTTYTSGSFHTPAVNGDLAFEPGKSVTDE